VSAPRAFRFCSASGLQALQRQVAAAFSAWAQDRLCAGAAPAFEVRVSPCCVAGEDTKAATWVPHLSAHGGHGSFWATPDADAAMQALLFGGTARPDGMAVRIAREAVGELLEAIADAAPRDCAQEIIDASIAGRALAQVHIACREHALVLLAELPDPNLLPLRPAESQRLASYGSALLPHQVTVRASLGAVELDLGTLYMLRPGDILRLDCRLDAAVDLDIAGERLHCDAYLVAAGQRRALELSRLPHPPTKDSPHA
jgi:flagellar motor switch/type III secretory pathway protein FliN